MKHTFLLCSLVASFTISNSSLAQSASVTENNATANKTIVVEGKQFPMSASEYATNQKAYNQQKALNQQKPVATQNATAQKPVANNYPAYKPENTTPVALKPTVVNTEAAAPVAQNKIEVQIITTDDVKALNASQKQVPTTKTEMAKPTATPYADKTIPGTMVPLPNSSLIANEAAAVQSTETPVNTYKMPEVKLTQEAQKVETTTPVTNKKGSN